MSDKDNGGWPAVKVGSKVWVKGYIEAKLVTVEFVKGDWFAFSFEESDGLYAASVHDIASYEDVRREMSRDLAASLRAKINEGFLPLETLEFIAEHIRAAERETRK